MQPPELDVDRILDLFCGASGCALALCNAGFEISPRTVQKWRERGRLPMSGWLCISRTHELMVGHPLNLNDFIKRK